jgi:hypothetical protein
MKTKGRWRWAAAAAGLGLALAGSTGCQTWVAGMTLPSPRYLQHPPQFIPSDPVFPLSRELTTMQGGRPGVLGAPGVLPVPVPGGVAPGVGGPPPGAIPGGGGPLP